MHISNRHRDLIVRRVINDCNFPEYDEEIQQAGLEISKLYAPPEVQAANIWSFFNVESCYTIDGKWIDAYEGNWRRGQINLKNHPDTLKLISKAEQAEKEKTAFTRELRARLMSVRTRKQLKERFPELDYALEPENLPTVAHKSLLDLLKSHGWKPPV